MTCPGCGSPMPDTMFLCMSCASKTPDPLIVGIGASLDAHDMSVADAMITQAVGMLGG